LNTRAEYETNHELIDDFSHRPDDLAGISAGVGVSAAGAGAGWLTGIGVAALAAAKGITIGSAAGPIGAIVGAVVGGVVGIAVGMAAEKATLVTDEVSKKNIDKLSKAYASGKTGTSRGDIVEYIKRTGMATGSAAEEMADAFLKNKDSLLEYGKSLNQAEAQMEAYYNSIAVNA
jgi:hypothetical protein